MSSGCPLIPPPSSTPTVARNRLSRPCCALVFLVFLLCIGPASASQDPLVQHAYPEPAAWSSDAESFDNVFLKEAALPQHNRTTECPEGQNGRFVGFSGQVWEHWSDLLPQQILHTILAYESNRAPVFPLYEAWAPPPRHDHIVGTDYEKIKIPYNALLSGPTAGSSWGANDRHPRAVSQKWWEDVCPPSRRRVIDATKFLDAIGMCHKMDGKEVIHRWSTMLKDIPNSCVEITSTRVLDACLMGSTEYWSGFDIDLERSGTGSIEFLSLWPLFSTHPAVKNSRDSEIALHALSQNLLKLERKNLTKFTLDDDQPISTIPGLVAVHIRRGYFYTGDAGQNNGQCNYLARWGRPFFGWSQLPQLVDKFSAPTLGANWTIDSADGREYMRRCLPTPLQVAEHLHAIRSTHPNQLTNVYIGTTAEEEYLTELRDLLVADGWDRDGIVTSDELELNWQATLVKVPVNMAVMTRAEVFVGHGFSSLSSNVIMRRLTTGKSADTCRLW